MVVKELKLAEDIKMIYIKVDWWGRENYWQGGNAHLILRVATVIGFIFSKWLNVRVVYIISPVSVGNYES